MEIQQFLNLVINPKVLAVYFLFPTDNPRLFYPFYCANNKPNTPEILSFGKCMLKQANN